jgi:hypothetical protein
MSKICMIEKTVESDPETLLDGGQNKLQNLKIFLNLRIMNI